MDGLNLVSKVWLWEIYFLYISVFWAFCKFWNGCVWLFFFFFVMLVFWQKKYKTMFLRVAYGQYPNMFWTFFYIQKILEVSKMCFRMDFLNTKKKIIFLHFWILQHICKTPKGIDQYSKKYKNLIFWGEVIYYSPLMFG